MSLSLVMLNVEAIFSLFIQMVLVFFTGFDRVTFDRVFNETSPYSFIFYWIPLDGNWSLPVYRVFLFFSLHGIFAIGFFSSLMGWKRK